MFLVTEWFGAFLLDGDGAVKEQRLFPKDARALGALLKRMQDGQVLEEERQLAVRAEGELSVREPRHQGLPGARLVERAPTLADRAGEIGYPRQLLHDASIEQGKLAVRESSSRRDMHVVQAVDAIDELTEQANVMVERLREWYALHFPELVENAQRNEEIAALVSAHVTREAIMEAQPQYREADSMGGPLGPREQDALRAFARTASTLYSTRAELEKYLDDAMMEVAPNVATLLQPVLAARMVKQAGGLRRLAMLPAGTIQTLGAEKALFRHIKEGKRPPKHGYLMQHPLVHRAPRYHRGALARSLAAKVALAARADAFTHAEGVGAKLAAEFEQRAENLRDQQIRQRKAKARGKGGFKGGKGGPKGGFKGGKGGFQGKPAPRRGGEWR